MNCMPRGILLAAEGCHAEAVRSRDHPPLIYKNKNKKKSDFEQKCTLYKGKRLQSLVFPEDIQPCFALLMRAPPHCGLPLPPPPPPPLLHPPCPGTERWSSSRAMNGRLVVLHINFSKSTRNKKITRFSSRNTVDNLQNPTAKATLPTTRSRATHTATAAAATATASTTTRAATATIITKAKIAATALLQLHYLQQQQQSYPSRGLHIAAPKEKTSNCNDRKNKVTDTAAAAKISNNKTIHTSLARIRPLSWTSSCPSWTCVGGERSC